jgi:hypothetical protein
MTDVRALERFLAGAHIEPAVRALRSDSSALLVAAKIAAWAALNGTPVEDLPHVAS